MREPLQGILQRFAMREAEGAQHELVALLESLARVLETPACFIRAAGASPALPLAVWPAQHRREIHALLEGCDAMGARSEAGLLASRVAAPVSINGVPSEQITHVLATPLRTAPGMQRPSRGTCEDDGGGTSSMQCGQAALRAEPGRAAAGY